MQTLEQKRVFITGGSRGLGLGVVEALVARDAYVTVLARDSGTLARLRDRLGVSIIAGDAADPALAEAVLREVRPSVLVLNVGAQPAMTPLDEQTWESFSTNWNTDAKAAFHWIQAALHVPLVNGSRVLLSSSGAAIEGSPLSGGYAGAKRMIWFMAGYANGVTTALNRAIRFQAVLVRQIVGATELGRNAAEAYARRKGVSMEAFLARFGKALTSQDYGEHNHHIAHRPPVRRRNDFCHPRRDGNSAARRVMAEIRDMEDTGKFESRYLAFLETISPLRPRLHRYCARMTGSITDGEDVVQDALFRAYRSLEAWDESRPLAPWIFRIAHNQCIDFLRSRGVRIEAETAAAEPDLVDPGDPIGSTIGPAIEHLVLNLPPKERACVLLKDVFEYSLEEIAELVDSTVGGVKAALNRGRSKLEALHGWPAAPRVSTPENKQILKLYVDRFNNRDWDGLRELISADARLLVADRYSGSFAAGGYLGVYSRMKQIWRLTLGEVDGEPSIILLNERKGEWAIEGIVRLDIGADGQVEQVSDYQHCPWILTAGSILVQ